MTRLAPLLLLLVLSACASRAGSPTPGIERRADLVYSPAGWPAVLHGDFLRPTGTTPVPVVILVHGGGWVRGERGEMDSLARRLVARGYAVFNISYRLAPAFVYPAPLDDVQQAVRWLRAESRALGVDPARVAIWGYSAGAHLAALAGTVDVTPALRVQAVVAGGLPADLERARESELVGQLMGVPYAGHEAAYRGASPLWQVTPGDAPMFLYHGTWDWIVWTGYSRQMHAALAAAGVSTELYLLRGHGHIASFLLDGGAAEAAMSFLDRQLRVR